MAEAIPTGPAALNQPADQMLHEARSQAMASLPAAMASKLSQASKKAASSARAIPTADSGAINPTAPAPSETSLNSPDDRQNNEPDVNAVAPEPLAPIEPPPDATAPPPAQTHGNGQLFSLSNAKDFLRDAFKGTGTEVKNALPRMAAKLGGLVTMAGGGLAAMIDNDVNTLTGKDTSRLADSVFDFKKNYIDSAIDSWTPDRAQQTGDETGTGGGAQFIGGAAEAVPLIFTGPAGVAALVSQAGIGGATQSIDSGHKLSTAAATGAVDALSMLIMSKIGSASPSVVKRIASSVAAGDMTQIAANIVKKGILKSEGYQKEADALSPFDGLGEATIQNGVFGFVRHGKTEAKNAPPADAAPARPINEPPPEAVAPEPVQPTPPAAGGPSSPASPEAVAPATEAPAPVPAVPDVPSAEPVPDLTAQFQDAANKGTQRTGVLISKANMDALATSAHPDAQTVRNIVKKAQADGRLVKTDNGTLVMASVSDALKAKNAIKSGGDQQAVIGRITGAGEGKTPDQTAVVQGQTPEGAVATESAVRPDEIAAKVADVKAEGKTPVVTTPEAAIARRNTLLAQEPRMGLAEVGKRELPVHIEEGASEGMTRVRPLNDLGEPGELTHDIPSEKVRSAPESKPAPEKTDQTEPPAPEEAPAKGAESQLETALNNHVAQEDIPTSRVNAMPLADRQDNASTFAGALLSAAKEASAKGGTPPEVLARAQRAAEAGLRFTEKSEESTRKGRGTSHSRISAVNEEMHKAARQLLGKAKSGDEVPAVAPKAAALKARVEKAKTKAEEPAPTTEKAKSPAQRAREEVLAGGREENALTTRLIKKRTVEITVAEAKAKAAEAKAKTETMVEAPVNKELEPVVEPEKPQTVSQRLKEKHANEEHSKLVEDYSNATDDEAPEMFDRVVASAEKMAGRKMTTAEKGVVYRKLENDREATKQTSEESDAMYRSTVKDLLASKSPLNRDMGKMNASLEKSGFFSRLQDVRASGGTASSHALLREMLPHAPNEAIRGVVQSLLRHMPDAPVRPMDTIHDPGTNKPAPKVSGLFTRALNLIQVQMKPGQVFSTEAMIHEMVHAATVHELRANPVGDLAREIDVIRKEAIRRFGERYGQDYVSGHLAHFADMQNVAKPKDFMRDLYGLSSNAEFVAEAMANPDFQRGLMATEEHARPGAYTDFQNVQRGVRAPTLLRRVFGAIARWMGNDNGAPLLEHLSDVTNRLMEKQSSNPEFAKQYTMSHEQMEALLPRDTRQAMHNDALAIGMKPEEIDSLANIQDDDPPPLRNVDETISKTVGEEATKLIRKFVAGGRSGTMGALRLVKPAFTSYSQLMDRRMSDFGHVDDPKNPLRQLQEADDGRTRIQTEIQQRAKPIVEARLRLGVETSKRLGQLQIDSTSWGVDPSKPMDQQTAVAQSLPKFKERYDEFAARWKNTSPEAQKVFTDERDSLQWVARKAHRAGVDTALQSYDMKNIGPAQRALLYNVKDPGQYDDLIGPGKLIDVGESNAPLVGALKSMAGLTKISSIYFPLARHGDLVVQAKPEGTKAFNTQGEANAFADKVSGLSPGSKAKVANRGGEWVVDYKADYVSMHNKQSEAEADAARMRSLGFEVGHVTQKTFSKENAPLTVGLKDMVAEATRHINSGLAEGDNAEGAKALVETLRSTFLQMIAARSAYAGSKLARKATAGVKADEMGQNFAQHMQSSAWHTSGLASVFKQADALAGVRAAARDAQAPVGQDVMYRRGQTVEEIGKRMQQELQDYGKRPPGNALIAKLGFANFLMHPSQAVINMTQNFQVAIPTAAAKYGTARSIAAFSRAMKTVIGPSFKGLGMGFTKGATGHDILLHVLDAVRESPAHGRWARGENSPLQQLMDKGVIDSTFSNELGDMAKGSSQFWSRVFEYARLLPNMSETFNRVSTALAGLELTNGNVRATADLIRQTHFDYSPGGQPRAFKGIRNNLPVLGSSVVMFKTYAQGMAHLLYSNVRDSVMGAHNSEGTAFQKRAEAAKTVAGLVLATAIFSGIKGATPELVHLAAYAYNKAFGDKDKYFDLDNTMHRLLAEEFGPKAGDTLFSGLPTLAGINITNNIGINSLILNNPPDLLSSDAAAYKDFLFQAAGPVPDLMAKTVTGFYKKAEQGDLLGAINGAIPARTYQDAIKAFNLYSGGTTTAGGNMMVEPGDKWGSAMQLIGFTPQNLAKARERTGTAVDYAKFVKDRRSDLLTQFSHGPIDMKALNSFNSANPGRAITVGEIIKYRRFSQQSSSEAKGGMTRDPVTNKLLGF